MSDYLARARVLFEQSRYGMAADELRKAIGEDPHNAYAHALLAISLAETQKPADALAAARQAVQLAPDSSFSFYVLGIVLFAQNQYREAESAARQAIQLSPRDENAYALLGNILLQKKDWQGALAIAGEGLDIDPENVACTNIRAIALTRLGRRKEAGETIDAALSREPDNAMTHANRGWTLLESGKNRQAMEHFREALRLDPTLDWARQGIVEALKARNPLYRLLLGYFFWMSRLSARAQWGVIIGAYVLYRILLYVINSNPALEPLFWPLVGTYLGFALLTWTADPLFNLLLRLNRFGRLALSEEQLTASNWVGGFLLGALLLLVTGFAGGGTLYYIAAAGCAAMIIPVSGIFNVDRPKSRRFLTGYTILLGGVGVGSFLLALSGSGIAGGFFAMFVLGWVAYSWIANIVISRE